MRNSLLMITISISVLLGLSCKSNKYMEKEVNYILQLKSAKAAHSLDRDYESYKISNVKRLSKSKYEYRATFVCGEKGCEALELQLSSDESVVNYRLMDNTIGPVEASKGSKAHRTGPIGSQGGQ